jgi:hypothetical protein
MKMKQFRRDDRVVLDKKEMKMKQFRKGDRVVLDKKQHWNVVAPAGLNLLGWPATVEDANETHVKIDGTWWVNFRFDLFEAVPLRSVEGTVYLYESTGNRSKLFLSLARPDSFDGKAPKIKGKQTIVIVESREPFCTGCTDDPGCGCTTLS